MIRRHFMIGFLTLVFAASAPTPMLAADGDLDPTFGIGGRVRYEDSSGYPLYARASAIQSDGKVIVVGSIGSAPDGWDFVLVRFKVDGSLDTTFGIGGKITTDFGQRDGATAIAIQPDGKILAAGVAGWNPSSGFALARYNPDGSLDVTFGLGGKATTEYSRLPGSVASLAIQSDGKIVAAGIVLQFGPNTDFELARFNPDGSLDTTFGIDGKITTDFLGRWDTARAVAVQSDGKIVAAGVMEVPPSGTPYSGLLSWRGALVRYNKDGSLDTTFGTGGKVITDILGTSEINALSIQSDGKIIAAGRSLFVNNIFLPGPNGADFGLVRYNEDGSLDTTFGAQGRATADLKSVGEAIYAVSLQPDGKIIAAGESDLFDDWWPATVFGLARFNRDGSLDTTFGIGGKIRIDLPASQLAYPRSIGIQPDGKIVVSGGGETFDVSGKSQSTAFELARFNTTGLQIVSTIDFRAVIVKIGDSFDATLSGLNLTDRTYFDARFRSPGSTTDQVTPNWQQGTSARHTVPTGTEAGTWIVTGIRAHESVSDQGGEFVPVSTSITVEK